MMAKYALLALATSSLLALPVPILGLLQSLIWTNAGDPQNYQPSYNYSHSQKQLKRWSALNTVKNSAHPAEFPRRPDFVTVDENQLLLENELMESNPRFVSYFEHGMDDFKVLLATKDKGQDEWAKILREAIRFEKMMEVYIEPFDSYELQAIYYQHRYMVKDIQVLALTRLQQYYTNGDKFYSKIGYDIKNYQKAKESFKENAATDHT